MKSKALLAMAVGGLIFSAGAFADSTTFPTSAGEAPPSMTTINSLDVFTGGYKGWGPMANPMTPYSPNEVASTHYKDEMRDRYEQHAAVEQAREQVWVANAPLRADYEPANIGATKAQFAGGTVRFDSREHQQ